MRKMHLGLAALCFSLAAVAITACGDDSNPTSGCTTNEDCKTGEFCNAQKACAAGCRANSECNGGTCNTSTGQCSTPVNSGCTKNEDCKTGEFCNAQKACAAGCRADSECNGGTCDTSTGQCSAPQAATCTPACTGGQVCDDHQGAGNPTCVDPCTYDGCNNSQNCNLQTGLCEIAAACDHTKYQPDTCLYGQYCSGADVCDYVAKATCSNFLNSTDHQPQWNPLTSHGPIISKAYVSYLGPDQSAVCCFGSSCTLATVHLEAYTTSGTFPSDSYSILQMLTYLRSDGSVGTKPSVSNYDTGLADQSGGKNIGMDLNFCLPAGATSFNAGLVLTDGNETCVSSQ